MPKKNTKKSREWDKLIKDFLESLLIERNCSPLTIRNYRHYLNRFYRFIQREKPKLSVSQLDLVTVRRFRLFLSEYVDIHGLPLKRVTQAYHIITLRSFLRWLAKNNVKTLSPEKIDIPKGESRSLKFLTTEQVKRLLSQPKISILGGLRDKAILETLFSTGLRVSELVSLNRDKLNFQSREIGVIGKGGRPRVVFLSKRAIKWLRRYLDGREDKWRPLFIRYSGKVLEVNQGEKMRLSMRSIQRIVEKYVKKARLPIKISPHGIRHSFATDLLQEGANLREVQEMLGHKNVVTTQIYTHVTNRQLRKVHEEFHSGNQ